MHSPGREGNQVTEALSRSHAIENRLRFLRLGEGPMAGALRYGLFPIAFALVVGGGILSFHFFEIKPVMYCIGFGLMPVFFQFLSKPPTGHGDI